MKKPALQHPITLVITLSMALAAAASMTIPDLISTGRMDEAVRLLNDRIQSAPNDAEAYHLLSRAYFHLEKWDQAVSYGEKAVKLDPRKAEYYLWLGRAYGEKADDSNFLSAANLTKKIRQNFEKAVEVDPNNVDARTDLAEFYVEAPGFMGGGTDKAAKQAEIIEKQNPARAHWVRAKIAEKKKDHATAEREYKAAIQAGQDASYWLNLASYYRRVGRLDDMQRTVDQAMQAKKSKSSAYFDAATLLFKGGRNYQFAADLVRQYLKAPPNEEAPAFEAHWFLGQILEKQGDRAGAASEYRASLALASNYSPAKDGLRRVTD